MCQCLLAILAIFLPPVAVLLHGGCNSDFCINLLLTLLLLAPGIIHAWWVILCKEDRATNIYIQTSPGQQYGNAPPAYSQA
ncbi:unnamed protein product [Caenorhabditis angaria]|uniref:Uncharacterized protein n=1 Tax=Caenorhabditis angaria TaxID=860376 RepID=A0A9P1IHD5_9PELO|nr:unnamed protein product [Caenorhabditis angaria]